MECEICNKKINKNSKTFTLSIEVSKNILTNSGYGDTKEYKSISGHYHCLKRLFDKLEMK